MGRDARLLTVPLRLNRLGIKTQLFRIDVSALIWDYKVKNDEDDDDDIDDNDVSEGGNEDNDSGKPSEVDDDDDACSSPTKKHKYSPAVVSPAINKSRGDTVTMDKLYPNLSRALGGEKGFDPTIPSVQRSMCSLLSELNDLLSTTFQLDVTELSNNKKISYVKVPQTASNHSFLNGKDWVDYAIQISAGSKNNGTFDLAYHIANHIARYYRDSFLAACETQRVSICKPMTATEFQGMISVAGLSGTSEKELKKHLNAHLGKGFCPT
jgi:hypothetical protein